MAFDRLRAFKQVLQVRRQTDEGYLRTIAVHARDLRSREPGLLQTDRDMFAAKLHGELADIYGADWPAFLEALSAFLLSIMPFIEMIIDLFLDSGEPNDQYAAVFPNGYGCGVDLLAVGVVGENAA